MGKRITPLMRLTALLLVAAIALTTVGCSGNGAEDEIIQPNTAVVDTTDAAAAEPEEPHADDNTLTIATISPYTQLPQIAAKFMRDNPGTNIEIIVYTEDNTLEGAQTLLATQLMAGSGPVLMDGYLVDYNDPRTAIHLADWFPVMFGDPDFDEGDWFMNIFHATSTNGRLYAIPTMFYYTMAAANSTIPGLHEAMPDRGGVTISELMELQREIPTESPFYLSHGFNSNLYMELYTRNYVDLEDGRVDFNNQQFIDTINFIKEITDPEVDRDDLSPFTPDQEPMYAERYFFHMPVSPILDYRYFFSQEQDLLFTDMVPLVNEENELVVTPVFSYLLNASASPAAQSLAWDFFKFMMETDNQEYAPILQPVKRELLRYAIEKTLPEYISENGLRTVGTVDEAVEEVVSALTAIGEMRMHNTRNLPYKVNQFGDIGVVPQAMQLFQDGLVSAEQTALDLQNQVELVLMEMGLW